MRECFAVNIGGIFAGGWLDVPFVEFGAGGGETGAMDGVDSGLNVSREGVAINEIQCEEADQRRTANMGRRVFAVWWKYW